MSETTKGYCVAGEPVSDAVGEEFGRLIAERDALRDAGRRLRAAQRAYMADRGNEEKGRAVAAAASALDAALAPSSDAEATR